MKNLDGFTTEELQYELDRRANFIFDKAADYREHARLTESLRVEIVELIRQEKVNGVSQRRIAETMGVSNVALSRWVKGTRKANA